MFCPGGKKAVNTKQKTCRTKDGELAVETSEVYGDLDSVQDVLVAWNTLSAIWQKIFPEWPAAQIALSDFQDEDVQSLCEQDRLEWG